MKGGRGKRGGSLEGAAAGVVLAEHYLPKRVTGVVRCGVGADIAERQGQFAVVWQAAVCVGE